MSHQDQNDLIPICYRCGSANHVFQMDKETKNDSCFSCFHPFVRCFVNFDILPLIEFQPTNDISYDQAVTFICDDAASESNLSVALFNNAIDEALSDTEASGYVCVKVDEATLKSLNREDIYVIRDKNCSRFYRNIIPEIGLAVCQNCSKFFHEEDYEYEFLKQNACPFCRTMSSEVSVQSS